MSVSGCLALYVGPVTDWRPVPGAPCLQHPGNSLKDKRYRKWMDGCIRVVLWDGGSFVNITLGWQKSIMTFFIPQLKPNRWLKRWSSPEMRRLLKRSFTCHRWDKQNRSRLTSAGCIYIWYDVTSHCSESAGFLLIKEAMIDGSIQVSHRVSIESVITQQILREQFRRRWRGGWRWLMSWGTGNWLWVERAEWRQRTGIVLATFSSFFLFILLSLRTTAPSLRHSRGKTERIQTYYVSIHLKSIHNLKHKHKNLLTLYNCILLKRGRTEESRKKMFQKCDEVKPIESNIHAVMTPTVNRKRSSSVSIFDFSMCWWCVDGVLMELQSERNSVYKEFGD